jgi:protein SCO1/2
MRTVILTMAGTLVVLIIAAAIWRFGFSERPVDLSPAMVNIEGADIGGPFDLVSHTGERVASEELIDGPTLIYFGYTFCPDVCPVDTQVMVQAVDILAEQGIEVTPVFITVDPERDTPEALAGWAEAMHPDMVALTGTPDEIKEAADAYKVFYQKVETPDSAAGYLMNHTSYFYLMTPERGITALFRRDVSPEDLAADIARVMAAL